MNWGEQERESIIVLVLNGASPEQLSKMMRISVEEVGVGFKQAFYSKVPYTPSKRRTSRSGLPITDLEKKIVKRRGELGLPREQTARILARTVAELFPDYNAQVFNDRLNPLAPRADQLLAYHYLFHSAKTPIISDQAYDDAKSEEIEFGTGTRWLHLISKPDMRPVDYPDHIRSLAYYMLYKHMEATGEWEPGKLPYGWITEDGPTK